MALFAVRRADIETFARDLETRGPAWATVTRRLSTMAGFYRYAVQEGLLDRSPAAHVRRPRLDYESHAVALDRNELGALLVAALGPPGEPPQHQEHRPAHKPRLHVLPTVMPTVAQFPIPPFCGCEERPLCGHGCAVRNIRCRCTEG